MFLYEEKIESAIYNLFGSVASFIVKMTFQDIIQI